MRHCFLIMLFFIHFNFTYSQDKTLAFIRISTQNGLSNSWVRCIYQDNAGFIWIGTADGLNRYDGYDFTLHFQIKKKTLKWKHNKILNQENLHG